MFFAANPKATDDRAQRMPPGAKLLVSGKLEEFNGRITMPHPDHVLPLAQADRLPAIEPVWRMTAGLWPRQVGNAMREALLRLPNFPEWHDPALLRREKLTRLRRRIARRAGPRHAPRRPSPPPPRL